MIYKLTGNITAIAIDSGGIFNSKKYLVADVKIVEKLVYKINELVDEVNRLKEQQK